MKHLALSIIMWLGLMLSALSQTAGPVLVSPAGGRLVNTGYQLDWSLGEPVTFSGGGGSYLLTQGFHQNSYSIVDFNDNLYCSECNISAYPNPATDLVFIKVERTTPEQLRYIITDSNGKVLKKARLLNDVQALDFSGYTSGVYVLSITNRHQLIKSFRIIKTGTGNPD